MKFAKTMHTRNLEKPFRKCLTILCVFFIAGIFLGQWVHGTACSDEKEQLHAYLLSYAKLLAQSGGESASPGSVLLVYFRYPVAAFLLGFTSLGVILLPALCLLQGFFLSYSVACFATALAREGVVLALSAFGIRCLVTLPCIFLLSAWALEMAAARWQRQSERKRPEGPICDSVYLLRFLVCVLILLFGTVLERSIVPKIVALALAGVS